MQPWFSTYAVVLYAGTGEHDRHPIVGFDRALGAITDCNLIEVSSIVPPSARVCRMRRGTSRIEAQGLHVPTVYTRADATGQQHATAGIGIGICPGRAGLIMPATGASAADVTADLADMIEAGMKDRGADDWQLHVAAATTEPIEGHPHLVRCAVAALCFVELALWHLFEPHVDTIG